ncbi:hypothetical protein MTP10_25945 [Nonomuraea sp. 3-1Str]|jgi:hypothetical protein|uniref:hypothetical protein n=1 Tax=Nonomuraea TaxID=83681 RepID=UPI001CD96E7B|nr:MULTISPECIES: hypothetical protein [Nonomuraea]MCA2229745.1 hypothetical protein [Nonomuraea aurantiaca]MDR8412168.1 hypothetical protein [Nonomuraea sp. 3-1Str]
MSDVSVFLLNLIIFAIAIESDIGRRKVGLFRLLRPVAGAAALVPIFFDGFELSGTGLLLEAAATVLGLAMGLAAVSFMRFEYVPDKQAVYSRAGLAYVTAWVAITLTKVAFSYGATHVFGPELGRWMAAHDVGANALKAAIILLNVSTMLARVGGIHVRARATAAPRPAPVPAGGPGS